MWTWMGFPCGGMMECPCGRLGWDSLVVAWGGLGWNALVADLDGMGALAADLDGIPLWRHGADLDGMPLQQTWMGCPCGGLGWDSLVAALGGLGWNALVAELDGLPLNLAFRNPTYTAARCQILPISKNLSQNGGRTHRGRGKTHCQIPAITLAAKLLSKNIKHPAFTEVQLHQRQTSC